MDKRGKLRSSFSKEKLVCYVLSFIIILFILLYKFHQYLWPINEATFKISNLIFAIVLFLLFYAIDRIFKIEFETKHYLFMGLIVIGSYVLMPLYHVYFYYDKFLHFTQSLLLSAVVFHMIKRLKIKKKWAFIITIFIIVGIGSMFEITEFGIDRFYGLQTQGVFLRSIQGHIGQFVGVMDPLTDTDLDMLFNLLGSLAFPIVLICIEFFKNSKLKDVKDFLNSKGT